MVDFDVTTNNNLSLFGHKCIRGMICVNLKIIGTKKLRNGYNASCKQQPM